MVYSLPQANFVGGYSCEHEIKEPSGSNFLTLPAIICWINFVLNRIEVILKLSRKNMFPTSRAWSYPIVFKTSCFLARSLGCHCLSFHAVAVEPTQGNSPSSIGGNIVHNLLTANIYFCMHLYIICIFSWFACLDQDCEQPLVWQKEDCSNFLYVVWVSFDDLVICVLVEYL